MFSDRMALRDVVSERVIEHLELRLWKLTNYDATEGEIMTFVVAGTLPMVCSGSLVK